MTPQQFYNHHLKLKEQAKEIHGEISHIEQQFFKKYGSDHEYPIVVEGKGKHVRIFQPEGKYVYNTQFELGVRVMAKLPVGIFRDGEDSAAVLKVGDVVKQLNGVTDMTINSINNGYALCEWLINGNYCDKTIHIDQLRLAEL